MSGTGELKAMWSQVSPLAGPQIATPTSEATTADATPARSGTQRRCATYRSRTGASDGFSATVIPNSTAASTARPRRSASQPATSPTSSTG